MTEEQEQDLVDIKAAFERDEDGITVTATLGEAELTLKVPEGAEDEADILANSIIQILESVDQAVQAAERSQA